MQSYIPDELPVETIDFKRLFKLVGEANGELARFDGLLQSVVQPELMLAPLVNEEAERSSRIEGTQATVEDLLRHDAGLAIPKDKIEDVREIANYRSALKFAAEQILIRPISLGFIREMHQILTSDVRGGDKTPGAFRTKQNFIGRPGATIDNATFVPPDPIRIQTDLEAWERYVSGEDTEVLLQCAVMHAQFELLHPFNDGNGRTGRLLIPLFLRQKKKLSQPAFYISAYLERYREQYYDCLRRISQEHDWNSWIEFFLKAVSTQAKHNCRIVKKILDLYGEMKKVISETLHTQFAIPVLDALFQSPVFSSIEFYNKTGIKRNTARSLLKKIRDNGFLDEISIGTGRTPSNFVFKRLLNITEDREIYPE
ncbi:MAG: Fic family protein [Thermoguttaceae bacterium]